MNLPDPFPSIGGLNFPVIVDGKRVTMRISEEALQDHFGATSSGGSYVEAYRQHSHRIDAKATEKYLADPSTPVLVRSADFS